VSVTRGPGAEISWQLRCMTPAVLHGETRGWSYFDGPSGTQMISPAIEAFAAFARSGLSNRHGYSPAGDETEDVVISARALLRSLLHAEGYHVVFGQNMTSLAFSLGHALARQRGREGARVVVTELEHLANVDPWVQPFSDRGGSVHWLRVDPGSFTLQQEDIERAGYDGGVAIVAATGAANAVGAVPDLAPLRELAAAQGAVFVVDGVHVVPHAPPDLAKLGADIFLCSAYKFYGPHVGVALVREGLLDELAAYKVTPAPSSGAEKLETGSQNHEGIAALAATITGLGRLVGSGTGEGARQALQALGGRESDLAELLLEELRSMDHVRVFGHEGQKGAFVATVAFTIAGRAPCEVATALRHDGVFVTAGDFYATALASRVGVDRTGGLVRAGLAGYTSEDDVHHLVESVKKLDR
jgi:cysteine desulfurase family protein (TIGR01976 family)